jgi:hypothetical protein
LTPHGRAKPFRTSGRQSRIAKDVGKKVKRVKHTKPQKPETAKPEGTQAPAHRVRLPGFLIEEEIGLGDAIKRVTYAMGIAPCQGCEKRAAALNRWMHFTR